MAKCFSKKMDTKDDLSITSYPKVMSRCLSAPDVTTSLPQEPFYYLKLNSGIGNKEDCSPLGKRIS